jgi:hypothetical protein
MAPVKWGQPVSPTHPLSEGVGSHDGQGKGHFSKEEQEDRTDASKLETSRRHSMLCSRVFLGKLETHPFHFIGFVK